VADQTPDPNAAVPAPAAPAAKPAEAGFAFTDPGCRTDVRLGALVVLGAVFLWLWWGPSASSRLYLAGAALLLWGVPLQALQARREGRPGFPWKLGLVMAIGGAVMWPDLTYREPDPTKATVSEWPKHVQEVAPLLLVAGAWILAWWPVARSGRGGRDASVTGAAGMASQGASA
jgi:hypothetical protein